MYCLKIKEITAVVFESSSFERLKSMLVFLIAIESNLSLDSIFCLNVTEFFSFFYWWSFRCAIRYWMISFFYRTLCFRYADFVHFAYFAQNLHFTSQHLHFRFHLDSSSSSWNFCSDLDLSRLFESMFLIRFC